MTAKDVYGSLGGQKKRFLSWQVRTIIVTMIGYAIFYFVRVLWFMVSLVSLTDMSLTG